MLESAGYEVLSAADGERAIQFFTAFRFDLVLLNYEMPVMNGKGVAEAMKRLNRLVPIILVSATSVDVPTENCVVSVLRKAGGPELLLREVGRALEASPI